MEVFLLLIVLCCSDGFEDYLFVPIYFGLD